MEGPEWNYTALSPKKRELGELLLKRLRARFAPSGFVHFGQGKWYPGEPLPRWALGHHLAYRRRADVAARRPHRRHDQARHHDARRRQGVRRAIGRGAGPAGFAADYRVRGRAASDRRGSRAAGQCRPDAGRPRGPRRASAPRAHPARRSRRARGIRAAAARHRSAGAAAVAWQSSPWPLRRGHLFAVGG